VVFLEASDEVLMRRFSETRRPHPLGTDAPVKSALKAERRHLSAIRAVADLVIDTSKFNVHELRAHITERFKQQSSGKDILVSCVSFGFRQGVPEDSDLVGTHTADLCRKLSPYQRRVAGHEDGRDLPSRGIPTNLNTPISYALDHAEAIASRPVHDSTLYESFSHGPAPIPRDTPQTRGNILAGLVTLSILQRPEG